VALPLAVPAGELDLSLDVRAVSSTATPSRLGGGLGTLRYDAQHEGLRLGYLRLGYRGDVTQTLRVTAEAVSYGDHDVNPIDLTEIYAEWRPIPRSAWRSRLKVGAFYPDISLENRMRGWRSPYTLSYSAINTWVGEELRTIGSEYSLDWLGLTNGHDFEFSARAALFGWNDPAGTVVATRGWGLNDRQDTLFGRFAARGQPLPARTVIHDEMDRRAGYQAGLNFGYRGLLQLRALHYDNRADPSVYASRINDVAWQTYFDSAGLRWTPDAHWTLIAQWLHGRTFAQAAPGNAFSFHSEFLLGSWKHGANRVSLRYDRFASTQDATNFNFNIHDDGHAWTVSLQRSLRAHWSATIEWLGVRSSNTRRQLIGQPVTGSEQQLQLALRYEL
jgi:hypothetical protein